AVDADRGASALVFLRFPLLARASKWPKAQEPGGRPAPYGQGIAGHILVDEEAKARRPAASRGEGTRTCKFDRVTVSRLGYVRPYVRWDTDEVPSLSRAAIRRRTQRAHTGEDEEQDHNKRRPT